MDMDGILFQSTCASTPSTIHSFGTSSQDHTGSKEDDALLYLTKDSTTEISKSNEASIIDLEIADGLVILLSIKYYAACHNLTTFK